MIKITHKDIAKLIGKSEKYTRVLLSKHKIRIKPGYLSVIFDLIQKYKEKDHGKIK
jgi:DNA-directed RNA polymerase subunit F